MISPALARNFHDGDTVTGNLRCLGLAETVFGVLIALQFPPGILGHSWMPVQLVLAVCGIGYMALRGAHPFRQVSIHPVRYLAIVVLYMFAAHFVVEPETMVVAVKELVIGMVGLVFIGTLAGAARPRDLLVALVLIHAVLGASDLMFLTAKLAGVERVLDMANIPLKEYLYPAQWNLPVALVIDQPVSLGGLVLRRAIGIYREPGVYQAFALTAFCAALLLRDLPWRRTLAVIILFGSACTFSTAWLASLGAIIIWTVISRTDLRRASSLMSSALLLVVLVGIVLGGAMIPDVGFDDKLAGESGQDRLRAFDALAPSLTLSPWWGLGHGTLQSKNEIDSVSGSLIVGVARLGIIGTLLFLGSVAATLFERHDRRCIPLLIPLGMTLLTSQPLYYSAAAYFILALPGRLALSPREKKTAVGVRQVRVQQAAAHLNSEEPLTSAADNVWSDDDNEMPIVILDEEWIDDEDQWLDAEPIVLLEEEWIDDEDQWLDMQPIVILDEEWNETTVAGSCA